VTIGAVFVWFRTSFLSIGNNTWTSVYGHYNSGAGTPYPFVNIAAGKNGSGTATYFANIQLSSGGSLAQVSIPAGGTAEIVAMAVTSRSATDHEMAYYNHTLQSGLAGGTSSTNAGSATANANAEHFNNHRTAAVGTGFNLLGAMTWLRAFSAEEIYDWVQNPFAMMRPRYHMLAGAHLFSGSAEVNADLDATLGAATLAAKASNINANIAATLAPATLAGTASNISANLAATLDAATLASTAQNTNPATLAVTLDSTALAFGSVQVGPGLLGELSAALDDADLDASVEAAVVGTLAETLGAATLAAFARTNTAGTGRRRPSLSFY
jgi:hypothetical protein